MPIAFEPWTSYPSLTLNRLKAIATLIRDVRDAAVLLHDADGGDSSWNLGCRIYSRTLAEIRTATLKWDWLRVLPESQNLKFTFSVCQLPIKFYKGEVDDVPAKCLVRSFAELAQLKLNFSLESIEATNRLCLAVEADAYGNTTSITLVEVDDLKKPLRTFLVPLEINVPPKAENVVKMMVKPISLEKPTLVLLEDVAGVLESAKTGDKSGTDDSES